MYAARAVVDAALARPRRGRRARRRPRRPGGAAGGALDRPSRSTRAPAHALPRSAVARRQRSTPTTLGRAARPAHALLDARAAERFRGEVEPLDPVAGHIPGALNRFHQGQPRRRRPLQAGRRAARGVRRRCSAAAGRARWCIQCGSGVTACHNLLAMEHAGLAGLALYPGSWSEWSRRPGAADRARLTHLRQHRRLDGHA